MNSIDDIDFEAVVKTSPFEVEEQEEKHRLIIKGKYQELSQLISLYNDPSGHEQEQLITGESLTSWGHPYQKIYFWGNHAIIEVLGPNSETKELRYFKNIQPLTYSFIDTFNKVYTK